MAKPLTGRSNRVLGNSRRGVNPDGFGRSRTQRLPAQAVRFLTAGVLSYIVDAGLLWLAVEGLGWPLVIGASLAFGAGFVVNFSLGRKWVFPTRAKAAPQVVRYTLLVALNYVLTLVFLAALTHWGTPLLIAKTATVAVLAGLNFWLSKVWVYR